MTTSLARVLVSTCVLFMVVFIQGLPIAHLEESSLDSSGYKYLLYRGSISIELNGVEVISRYLAVNNTPCQITPSTLLVTIQYIIEITENPTSGSEEYTVNLRVIDLAASPTCLIDFIKDRVAKEVSLKTQKLDEIPLLLRFNESLYLDYPSRMGEVVGFTRLDLDLIHVSWLYTNSSASYYTYMRRDLYYEPVTNITVHYAEISYERMPIGTEALFSYVTLENGTNVFNNITRRVFNVRVREYGLVKDVVIVVIYNETSKGGTMLEPVLNTTSRSITIGFPEETLCFIQLGVLRDKLTSSIEMRFYNVEDGVVYYSAQPTLCKTINITLTNSTILGALEEKEYPERNLPPAMGMPTLGDLFVSVIVYGSVVFYTWLASSFIARKLITRNEESS